MKDKILIFIIGLLVGAIITTLGFYIYQKVNNNSMQVPQMPNNNGQMEQMMRPEDGQQPPEKPTGEEQQFNMGEPPQMPTGGNI